MSAQVKTVVAAQRLPDGERREEHDGTEAVEQHTKVEPRTRGRSWSGFSAVA